MPPPPLLPQLTSPISFFPTATPALLPQQSILAGDREVTSSEPEPVPVTPRLATAEKDPASRDRAGDGADAAAPTKARNKT
jgi:hypothetical protein